MAAALAIVVFLPAPVASNTACPPRLLSLLVQRAVQTCCFTSRQCRDPPTAEWLVGFGGHVGLETFHGIDGLRVPAEEYVLQLLRAPSEQITVHSALKKHRGLSASNPYLQPSSMTYMVTIQPADLADRVMRTAATIAAEWREDLPMIALEDDLRWEDHWDEVRTTGGGEAGRRSRSPGFEIDHDASNDSPYRGGNYDLLKALATHMATQTVADRISRSPARQPDATLLRDHLASHPLTGELRANAADAFFTTLIQRPYAILGTTLIDPLALATEVLDERQALARGWADGLEQVPDLFLSWRRDHLDRLVR